MGSAADGTGDLALAALLFSAGLAGAALFGPKHRVIGAAVGAGSVLAYLSLSAWGQSFSSADRAGAPSAASAGAPAPASEPRAEVASAVPAGDGVLSPKPVTITTGPTTISAPPTEENPTGGVQTPALISAEMRRRIQAPTRPGAS